MCAQHTAWEAWPEATGHSAHNAGPLSDVSPRLSPPGCPRALPIAVSISPDSPRGPEPCPHSGRLRIMAGTPANPNTPSHVVRPSMPCTQCPLCSCHRPPITSSCTSCVPDLPRGHPLHFSRSPSLGAEALSTILDCGHYEGGALWGARPFHEAGAALRGQRRVGTGVEGRKAAPAEPQHTVSTVTTAILLTLGPPSRPFPG